MYVKCIVLVILRQKLRHLRGIFMRIILLVVNYELKEV